MTDETSAEETNVILFPKIVHPLSERMSEAMLNEIKGNYFAGVSDFLFDTLIANVGNIVYHIDWEDDIINEMSILIQESICAFLYRTARMDHPLHVIKFGDAEEDEDDDTYTEEGDTEDDID